MQFIPTPEQLYLLQWIAQGITQAIKIVWVGLLKQPKPSRTIVLLVIFVISTVVGYFWSGVELPALTDPMAFAQALLVQAAAVFVVARVVYDNLTESVLGWLDTQVVSRLARRKVSLLAP